MHLLLPLLLTGCAETGLAGDWVAAFYRTAPVADDSADGSTDGSSASSGSGSSDTGADTGAADTGGAGSGDSSDDADTGDVREVLPACEGDVGGENFRAWIRIDETNPVQGVHLTLFPDDPLQARPEAANGVTPSSSMGGLVTGAWQDGQVTLDLVPDLDHPFASSADVDAWRDHHLQLQSTVWGSRCWTAAWSWMDADGVGDPVEQGVVFMRRQ
ncbi:MAG: hypothetical protein H6742_13765 [Alphaproteobacteria bacterium]|nr:hypothetical protein [Alphaproteobacteria bacterium]